MQKIIVRAAIAAMALAASSAPAALLIVQNQDIAAGRAAFGQVTTGFTFANVFAPGTSFAAGSYSPERGGRSLSDPDTGAIVDGDQSFVSLSIANYIDGVGFDAASGAAPDLALNGVETFTMTFTGAVRRIGLAVATGSGSFPSEFNNAGAAFTITTDSGDSGILTLVDPGDGLRAYVTITATRPFTSIRFEEAGGDIHDQYFGDVVAGPAARAIPEPVTWATMVGGLGLVGMTLRGRRMRGTRRSA